MNLIAAVFLLVALAIALVLGFLRIMQFSKEIWVGLLMILIGFGRCGIFIISIKNLKTGRGEQSDLVLIDIDEINRRFASVFYPLA